MAAFPEPEPITLDEASQSLVDPGFAVIRGFLDAFTVSDLRTETEALRDQGSLREAAVGRGEGKEVRSEIRSDRVLWIDSSSLTRPQCEYQRAMEALRERLNRDLFLGLSDLEAHLACYPLGAFYKPHLDCHRGVSTRVVTAIVYLNDEWRREDGGLLRLYTDPVAGTAGSATEIVPEAGKLVLFRAADFWHEVLPARRERFSLTGWFRTRDSTLV